MSPDHELLNLAGAESESKTLFDELAGLVPAERQAEYYRVIAHTRTLSPNDEMLRILEAMGILALLTRETPAEIAAERKSLRKILEASASQANAVERRMEEYTSLLESRLSHLPKELETGLDPPRIAKLLGESLRQCFQQFGLPDTARALDQSCSEMSSVQEKLVNMLREVAHPDIGVIARIRSANDSLLRSMTTRAQQMDNFLVRLENQVLAIWLPVVATAALAVGFALGIRSNRNRTQFERTRMLFDFVRAAFAGPRMARTDLSRRLRDGVSLWKTNWFLLERPLPRKSASVIDNLPFQGWPPKNACTTNGFMLN